MASIKFSPADHSLVDLDGTRVGLVAVRGIWRPRGIAVRIRQLERRHARKAPTTEASSAKAQEWRMPLPWQMRRISSGLYVYSSLGPTSASGDKLSSEALGWTAA
ncbi:hypothetical protein B5K06_30435 [Rhizobium grahamii]|uniref:Uncharacterized protein n=1 Tax=Rhizobium grahamii TaxID=1120045 RepID=A0A370KFU2_9HYPH|nr:hypothetical protein B5K06_30435 [Rhizobium grahamii]